VQVFVSSSRLIAPAGLPEQAFEKRKHQQLDDLALGFNNDRDLVVIKPSKNAISVTDDQSFVFVI